jgi:hypothetical protein
MLFIVIQEEETALALSTSFRMTVCVHVESFCPGLDIFLLAQLAAVRL